jgi:GNAT superfamily N-acetyltransferase
VAGVRLQVAMGTGTVARVDDVVAQVVALLRGAYWNDQFGDDDIARAHRGSQAWVGATDDAGVVIATARAISDGGKYAWIYDVMVAEPWRGKGLGGALVRLLVDHPAVRGARRMCLGTKDAHAVYRPFGFVDVAALPPRPYLSTMMVRVRPRLEPLAKTT